LLKRCSVFVSPMTTNRETRDIGTSFQATVKEKAKAQVSMLTLRSANLGQFNQEFSAVNPNLGGF